jgi:hypothetical protein
MSIYKVGDKVRVRGDLEVGLSPRFYVTSSMASFAGDSNSRSWPCMPCTPRSDESVKDDSPAHFSTGRGSN